MLRWIMMLLATVSFGLLIGSPASAAVPPRPVGPVYDGANILPPTDEAALDAKLRAYNAATGRAVIVATVASLDGLDELTYGQELVEAWGIGGKETEYGVLLLVAPKERRVRIATARGAQLEKLNDILAGQIIRNEITPKFKADDYPGGIAAGVNAIVAQLDRTPADAKAVAEAAAAAQAQGGGESGGAGIGGIIFWIALIVVFMAMFGGGRRGKRFGGRGGINPGIVLWGVSEIARGMASGGGGSSFGGGGGGGGFGGFGGGGGGFNGGGASGSW